MLRFLVCLLLAGVPASQPTTQDAASYPNLKAVIAAIPKDVQPPPGQKWNDANYKIVNDWCAANLKGANLTCAAVLRRSGATNKGVYFEFSADGASANSINVTGMKVRARSLRSDPAAIAKLPPGSPVTLHGMIDLIHFRAAIPQGQEIEAVMDDCEITPRRR
jgi:hypothetical protein